MNVDSHMYHSDT